MGPNLTPYPEIPGGYSVASETASDLRYIFLAKQEAFTVSVNGLMPSTKHWVFFEGKRVATSNIKPVNGQLGDAIYTDQNGQAEFVFYYQSDVIAETSQERYNEIAQRIGGNKTLIVANSDDSVVDLPSAYENSFSSFAKKNIYFKTTLVDELPVKTTYTFAYPPALPPQEDITPPGSGDNENGGDYTSDDEGGFGRVRRRSGDHSD